MKYTQSEKMEIIRMVEESNLSVRSTLRQLDINRMLSQIHEKPHPAGSLLLPFRTRKKDPTMGRLLQQPPLPRSHRQCYSR